MEIWKDIEGYEGLYQVSTEGRVRSLDRVIKRRNHYNLTLKGKLKPLHLDKKGYQRVQLSKESKLKTFKVHRMVAMAFIDNKLNKPQVNHIDAIKHNNNIKNLEWVTNSENQKHIAKLKLREKNDRV
jgi:hypothetical protein